MVHYGQALIGFHALGAPHAFTVDLTNFSRSPSLREQLDEDESGENRALILHSLTEELSWEGKVKSASTDFLDLSQGALLTVAGITGGGILAKRAVERWSLMQAKTISLSATRYPDLASPFG